MFIFAENLSFNDYVDICRKEPVTTADDLMKAFRKIDINGDGYISLDELYKIMNVCIYKWCFTWGYLPTETWLPYATFL